MNYHLFTKNSKVCTQLRNILERNKIDTVLNQELMHIIGERG